MTSDSRDDSLLGESAAGCRDNCSSISSHSSAASPLPWSLLPMERRLSRSLSSFMRLLFCRPPSLARLLTSTAADVSVGGSMPERLPVDVRFWLEPPSGGIGEEVTDRDGKRAARSCAVRICGRHEADECAEEGVAWLLDRKPQGECAGEEKVELAEAHDTFSSDRNDCGPAGTEEDSMLV